MMGVLLSPKENAVERFVTKHQARIVGTLSCFDRLLFKGHLPIAWADEMERFLRIRHIRFKDFGAFARAQSDALKAHAQARARRAGRPYEYLRRPTRKEDLARSIVQRDGVTEGLVCVLSAVEPCQSFRVAYGEDRPVLRSAPRKGLALYFYFLDRELGFLHVRLQTWFPFTVQVCLNGHEALARKLDRHGIASRRQDNAFLWFDDFARAQRFADRLVDRNWPRILAALARRVNPLLRDVLHPLTYYWVTEQAEYATDVIFESPAALRPLYDSLLKHATLGFSAEDVMTFLGRKLTAAFAGELLNHASRRWPGARVKHRMKENWIKMYDKLGCVLRIETVINRPNEFFIRRWGTRKGQRHLGWYPMAKGVANLYRYAEVSRAANHRYLNALAVVAHPAPAQARLARVAEPVRRAGRTYRGFNPASAHDARLFAAVLRGEHVLRGFRNHDIRDRLFPAAHSRDEARRLSACTWRLLRRLHVRGLIAKIPRSRRWRVTVEGHAILTALLELHRKDYLEALLREAS